MNATIRTVAAAAAVTLALAACNSGDDTIQPLDPDAAAETDTEADEDDEPTTPVDTDTTPEPVELEPVDAAVEAYIAFVAAADRYDTGDIDFDDVRPMLTDGLADALADDWQRPVDGDETEGQRTPNIVDANQDGDTVTIVDCVQDTRVADADAPGGLWREIDAEMVAVDGAWKVDRFSDFEGNDTLITCVPPDDADELRAAYQAYREAELASIGAAATPELSLDEVAPLVTAEALSQLQEFNDGYVDAGEHVAADLDYTLAFTELVMPDVVQAVACEEASRYDAVDNATGETLEDVSLQGIISVDVTMVRQDGDWIVAGSLYNPDSSQRCDGISSADLDTNVTNIDA